MEDLELFFLDKIKPYEERIRKLEDSERQKEYEITTLKHAIHNLNRVIEELKTKQATVAKPQPATGRGVPGFFHFSLII